jgi:uncharacterized Ntn-hydrolase superfamily protein
VTGKPTGRPWDDRLFDLRVDDSPEPLKELRRLVTLQRAYGHMNAGDLAVEKKDNDRALAEYAAAAQVFAMDRNWATLTPRLPKSGLLPDDPKIIDRIVKAGKD